MEVGGNFHASLIRERYSSRCKRYWVSRSPDIFHWCEDSASAGCHDVLNDVWCSVCSAIEVDPWDEHFVCSSLWRVILCRVNCGHFPGELKLKTAWRSSWSV